MIKKIVVERVVQKRLQASVIRQQLQRCADISLKGPRGNGWIYEIGKLQAPVMEGDEWKYTHTVMFKTTSNRKSLESKWDRIVSRFAEAGAAGQLRSKPWRVTFPLGHVNVASEAIGRHVKAEEIKALADEPKEIGKISLDQQDHYNRIYGREAHIRRLIDALRLAKETNWKKRTHTLLDGPPGCAKTEVMLATSRMLGPENEAWMWFDATNMTRAGVTEIFMKSHTVPGVLFLEEIEKCAEHELRWLLGVMDTRGQIRRTNFRVGNELRNVRLTVIATANDVELLKRVMSGALYSRFQNKIYCEPPNRTIMAKILEREVEEIDGNKAWIEPTLEFAYDKWGMNDPRDLIAILSCGGDRLLTGAYQQDYEATMHPDEQKNLNRLKAKGEKALPAS